MKFLATPLRKANKNEFISWHAVSESHGCTHV